MRNIYPLLKRLALTIAKIPVPGIYWIAGTGYRSILKYNGLLEANAVCNDFESCRSAFDLKWQIISCITATKIVRLGDGPYAGFTFGKILQTSGDKIGIIIIIHIIVSGKHTSIIVFPFDGIILIIIITAVGSVINLKLFDLVIHLHVRALTQART